MFKELIPIAAANLLTMSYLITVKTDVLRSLEHEPTKNDQARSKQRMVQSSAAWSCTTDLREENPGKRWRGFTEYLE